MPSVPFNDLPKKALNSIFKYIDQCEQQKLRQVCYFWKRFIDEELPVELLITEENYQRLFRCPNAVTVKIKNLVTEYTDEVAFGSTVTTIQFSGKVLTSNIFSILRYCPELEVLHFTSLKQVLGIQGTDSIKLPKTKTIEITVRPDQETFTSDEIIIISVLRQILFASLNTILISTKSPLEDWEENDDQSQFYGEDGNYTEQSWSPMPSLTTNEGLSEAAPFPPIDMSENYDDPNGASVTEVDPTQEPGELHENINPLPPVPEPNEAGTQTTNTNLHVIINRAANFRNRRGNGSVSQASSSSSTRRVRYNMSEFEARLFYANLELLEESVTGETIVNILNGSMSQTRMDSTSYFDVQGVPTPVVKHTVFFEFVRNNHATLNNFYVKARSDFMCFGNLSSFSKDLSKVQFEELDYSFGRLQVCAEYTLLRAQTKLKMLRVQVLDDLWKHLMVAVTQCQSTLQELDVKVMSISEDRVDISPITGCHNLKHLKLLHFFEKGSFYALPKSLNKLVLNGPISYKDMDTWTKELQELNEFTLLLNTRGDKVDLPLYKKFLKMPKLGKLTFIQCPMDLDSIQKYIQSNIVATSQIGFTFAINGPKEIKDLPFIQYVYTILDQEKFNRDLIVSDDS